MSDDINWALIQTQYQAGANCSAISRSLGGRPTRQAIEKRLKKEGWTRPVETLARLPIPATEFEELDIRQQAVIEAFALGASTIEEAAARGCVSVATVYRWKADDRFKRLCDAARLRARDELVKRIKQQGEMEWRPNAWLLEKLYKSEFGQAAVLQGNTFNILGSINLGIERAPIEGEAVEVGEITPA